MLKRKIQQFTPMGGVPDKSRETNLNFNRAYFIKAKFGEANFRGAKFDGAAHFFEATFDDVAPDEPLFTKPKIKPTGKIK